MTDILVATLFDLSPDLAADLHKILVQRFLCAQLIAIFHSRLIRQQPGYK